MQEIRNGTFRLIHNLGSSIVPDTFKISVSDGKHLSLKTFQIETQFVDKLAPYLAKHTTLLMNVKEGQTGVPRRDNIAFVDDQSQTEDIVYKILFFNSNQNNLAGKFYLRNKLLKPSMAFTQADIDLRNLK
jgi:hypothetical protein